MSATPISLPLAGGGHRWLAGPIADERFDWLMIGGSGWIIVGMWLDSWAHHHLPSALETFFTPWHGVLYSGLVATTAVLLVALVRGRLGGVAWRTALPGGYGLSLVGAVMFAAAGLADLAWHTLFGIEADVEALLSPPHLLLALAGILVAGGPLRAAWQRPGDAEPSLRRLLGVAAFLVQAGLLSRRDAARGATVDPARGRAHGAPRHRPRTGGCPARSVPVPSYRCSGRSGR
jgi:hypothetical protein